MGVNCFMLTTFFRCEMELLYSFEYNTVKTGAQFFFRNSRERGELKLCYYLKGLRVNDLKFR